MGNGGPTLYNKFFETLDININGKDNKVIEVSGNAKLLLDNLGGKENTIYIEAKLNFEGRNAYSSVEIKGLEGYYFPLMESQDKGKKTAYRIDDIQVGNEFISKKVTDKDMPKVIEAANRNVKVELPNAVKADQPKPMTQK
jgi:hypothetical protein